MSLWVGSTSPPASLLARAWWYQKPWNSNEGLFALTLIGPAEPRTPLVALHGVSGSNDAWMLIVTDELKIAPQIAAARLKQFSRCAPIVVPGLPPTGAAGVLSLKPSLGPSVLMMWIVAAANAVEARLPTRSAVTSGRSSARGVTCPPAARSPAVNRPAAAPCTSPYPTGRPHTASRVSRRRRS